MRSIKAKLVILYLALVFIVMIISGTFIHISIRSQEADKIQTELKLYSRIIDEQIIQVYESPQRIQEELNNPTSIFVGRSDIQVRVFYSDGSPIADYEEDKYTSSAIISAMAGEESFRAWERVVDTRHGEGEVGVWMSFATPTTVQQTGEEFIIYLRMKANSIQESLANTTNTIIVAVVLAMVLAGILGVLFASTLTGPISVLTKIAKEMAQGNLEQEIPVYGNDEIGQLTESFNNMGKSLHKTMHRMSSDKNRMEIIIHNMTDGIIAFNSNGEIIHANQSALDLLSLENMQKLEFNKVMSILQIEIQDINSYNDATQKDRVISIEDKFVNVSFNTYKNQIGHIDGIVIVLQDVTRHTKLENLRKEFVANVSHEIRTPLTIIKTYAETLIVNGVDNKEMAINFLNVINLEADRMTLLATDLLELSRFDNKQFNMVMEQTNLIKILENSIKQTSILASKKNQNIIFNPTIKNMIVLCDHSRINQVFVNILSNAIKYSGEDSDIEIKVDEDDLYYKIYIKDNGMGIPKEDIKRIFERFYRVDKARSRGMGGTGLGLAIVKEILEEHDAKIYASSQVGNGTTMKIIFKKVNVS